MEQQWIRSPLWDGFWILSGIPLGILCYFLSRAGVPDLVFIGLYVYLLGAHVPAPVVLAWRHPEFKTMMLQNKKRYILFPILFPISFAIMGLLAGLSLTSVAGGSNFLPHIAGPKDLLNAILVFFWIYIAWNGYHFSAQNFGVLSIYRNKVGGFRKTQRTVDQWFCHLNCIFLLPVCWYLAHYTFINSALVYFPNVSDQTFVWMRGCCLLIAGAALIVMFTREVLRNERVSLARLAVIANIGLLPIVIFISMPAFNAMYGWSHFLTAIGLTGHVLATNRAKRVGQFELRPFVQFYARYLLLIAIFPSFLVYKTMELEGSSNGFLNLASASLFITTVVGFRFGLAIVHFLYDRFVYKFSRPEVRKYIGADLFSNGLVHSPVSISEVSHSPTAQIVS